MFGWEYPPVHCGGLGVACQGIVRGLLDHGAHVTLVLPHGDAQEENVDVRNSVDGGMRMLKAPTVLQPYAGATVAESFQLNTGTAMNALYGPDLGNAVEQFTEQAVALTADCEPDVVHAHDWMTFGAGIRAARHHRRPLVAHVHATELDRTDFHPCQWIYDRERHSLLQAECVIAVSQYTRALLVREYGIPESKIRVVHNALPQNVSPTMQKTTDVHRRHPLVLFLGRLTVQKGAHQFLEAAKLVADFRSDVQFVIAGDGDLLPELMHKMCVLGLQDRVVFAGKVTSPEAMTLYQKASCFVMPSVSEPFGLVALEAIANGTPVILSRQSGAAEVVHNAFVVDYWDTEKMADCILTIIREEPLRRQMRAEAPHILSRLTWKNQAAQILSVYRSLSEEC